MASYVVLAQFTEQGIRAVKETVSRADAAKEAASKFGAKMKDIYWVQGQYDLVTFIEGDEQAVTAFGLALASQGNVKFQTLRAFSRDEMSAILKKV
ncbi:GYD domain-containing protein [Ramlibacter sp. PS4R-6]|uniref:GYD domain-containing protein n=1 Tax=Ramlibacter sp. PS4R-6 TaxID=3133438 RepID=UPI0030B4D408